MARRYHADRRVEAPPFRARSLLARGRARVAAHAMFPIRDINPTRTTPFVNYLFIVGNVAAFFFMKSLPPWYEPAYGLVPTRIVADPGGEAVTVFTSMFMH